MGRGDGVILVDQEQLERTAGNNGYFKIKRGTNGAGLRMM